MEMDIYSTKDFFETATFLSCRLPLVNVRREQGICHFVFTNTARLQQVAEAYWHGELQGNIRQFVLAQRVVKDLIHKGNEYGNDKSRLHQQQS